MTCHKYDIFTTRNEGNLDELYTVTPDTRALGQSTGRKLACPSFKLHTRRQQVRQCSCLKLDPPPIQCAVRVNSLLTEQSSYNFNSMILFSTFTRLIAYSWRRVQFETTTLAHLLTTCVKRETLEPGKVSTVYTDCGLCSGQVTV